VGTLDIKRRFFVSLGVHAGGLPVPESCCVGELDGN
jgi:hypothetical protein